MAQPRRYPWQRWMGRRDPWHERYRQAREYVSREIHDQRNPQLPLYRRYIDMTQKSQVEAFAETSLLVSLSASCPGAGVLKRAGVPESALEPVTKAIAALRTFHFENTLPWLDEGIRCLPTANYSQTRDQSSAVIGTGYLGGVAPLKDQYEAAVRDLRAKYPALPAEAFGARVRFMPLPQLKGIGDIGQRLTDEDRDRLREHVADNIAEGSRAAMADLYRRLHDSVKNIATKLRAYQVDEDGARSGVFRDSLVDNLRELVALVPRLNFAQDPELEAARLMAEETLCEHDAGTLREDAATRAAAAESAEEIAGRLGEFMGDGGKAA